MSNTVREGSVVDDISIDLKCTHEVLECRKDELEAGLDIHTKTCNKPHDGFIPIKDLNTQHFPPGYQDDDLLDLTKAMSALTVRISVTFVSHDRPDLTPITREPYPFHDVRGENHNMMGTGRVYDVTKYTKGMDEVSRTYRTCPCPACETSNTPKDEWWEAVVLTSSHVVFDDSEAKKSSCRLWFDEDKSPLFKMYGWETAGSSTVRDMAMFYCATHDSHVGDQLDTMVSRFDKLSFKIRKKYKHKAEDKVMIIVSHPHGCFKQVSIGRWVDKENYKNATSYTYTNCTCPGSSGASMYRIGWSMSEHPHCKAKSIGLNCSGYEVD